MMEETVIFTRKADVVKVSRRLRDFSILSYRVGREVRILVPSKSTKEKMRDLALKIHRGQE